jgi:exopolyphosphatase/guanosine-5'-triphosphate,3'-diphosphate pyrophosphatase
MAPEGAERRLAVIDLGSNSFRLVVFTYVPEAWWKRTDEIFESVRIGEGLEASGDLQAEPMERALETLELFAHFCRATGIDEIRPVATSAIREAGNRERFLTAARERAGLDIQVLSREEEARYGYLAAVNSTTLRDGVALDLGGGSMQLSRVVDRRARHMESWALGAVRMTERFLPEGKAKPKRLRNLHMHVREELASAPWLSEGGRDRCLVGLGGTVRNLAAAAMLAEDLPSNGVQGHLIGKAALDDLVERLAGMSSAERGRVPGIKPVRGDVILAGAIVVQSVLDCGGFDAIQSTEAGLREGVFFERLLARTEPPLLDDVRRATVTNVASQYRVDFAHARHVARLALEMWDELAAGGVHPGAREERDLLWSAAMLHDLGTAIDYDDHHKHSRYLILNARLFGFTPRETALIGQMARYHRKGNPSLGEFAVLARPGDDALLSRCSAVLRLAEQLERSRDQAVKRARIEVVDGRVELRLDAVGDVSIARWAATRQRDLFERAFDRELSVS